MTTEAAWRALVQGHMATVPISEAPEFKGSVIIEWPVSKAQKPAAVPPEIPVQRVIPGCLAAVRDEKDGGIIPCAGLTLHVPASGFITADVAVFLDKAGEIIRDPGVIWRESDGVPATFPFLVAEMRVRGS